MSDTSSTESAPVFLPGQTLAKLPPWRRARAAAPESSVQESCSAVLQSRPWRRKAGDEGILSSERGTAPDEAPADEQPQVDALFNESAEATVLLVDNVQSNELSCQPPPGLGHQSLQLPPALADEQLQVDALVNESAEATVLLVEDCQSKELNCQPPSGLEHLSLQLPPGLDDLQPPPGLERIQVQAQAEKETYATSDTSILAAMDDGDWIDPLPSRDKDLCIMDPLIDAWSTAFDGLPVNILEDAVKSLEDVCVAAHASKESEPEDPVKIADITDASDGAESEGTSLGSDETGCSSSHASQSPSLLDFTEHPQLNCNAPEFIPGGLRLDAPEFIPAALGVGPAPSSVPFPLFPGAVKKEFSTKAGTVKKKVSTKAEFRAPLPVGPVGLVRPLPFFLR